MLALRITFPAGRYHATSWGRHVNEADIEWPPSPWRIVRSIIATWHRKLDHTRFPESTLVHLLTNLASESPSYRIPPAVHAHTRHYMPVREGKAERAALVFDAFAAVPRDNALTVVWPSVELNQEETHLLDAALEATTYLGRAESWVEIRRLPEQTEEINCKPGSSTIDEQTGELLGDAVALYTPIKPAEYAARRTTLLQQEWPRRIKRRVEATLPESWLSALSLDTSDLQSAGWSAPPSAQRVQYIRPNGALNPSARPRAKDLSWPDVTTVRYALYGKPLPLITDAVKVGEWMRAAAMSIAKRLYGEESIPSLLSGHDLPEDNRHAHAFWLSEDADDDGRIDHIVVHVPGKLDMRAREVLEHIERLWNREGQEWRLMLEAIGSQGHIAKQSKYCCPSNVFVSVTPYLRPWHSKRNFGVIEQIRRECRERGWPEPSSVEPIPSIRVAGRHRRPVHFYRFRSKRGLSQPDTQGSFVRIRFADVLCGPIALGFGCHFGLGLFVPE